METRHRRALRALVVTIILVLTTTVTAQSSGLGRHYSHLEGQALRVVTEFANGAVATAVRAVDGSVNATYTERGKDTAKLTINGRGEVAVYLHDARGDSTPRHGSVESLPTLDWVNVHLYHSQKRLRKAASAEWDDEVTSLPHELTGVATTADTGTPEEISDDVQSVTTYFEDFVGYSRMVSIDDPRRATFTTVLTSALDGRQEASLRWSAHHRVLQWKVQEKQMATVTAKGLPNIPGWEPNPAWRTCRRMRSRKQPRRRVQRHNGKRLAWVRTLSPSWYGGMRRPALARRHHLPPLL